MKKFAILILAHNQFSILEKLMRQLDHERNDIFLHIDKKAKNVDRENLSRSCRYSRVTIIPSMRIHWGHASLVECELRLMEAARAIGEDYAYYHLLSGVDLQIKDNAVIHSFFDQHPDRQFLALRNTWWGLSGLQQYYFFLPLRTYSRVLAGGLQRVSGAIQTRLKVDRLRNADMAFCKSQQWFSITPEFAEYILTRRPLIRQLTRFTSCSDEMVIGTMLVNSPFAEQLYDPRIGSFGHMRLIDRVRAEGASPHTWTMEDWELIASCPYFWARKFDENRDAAIIEKVFETWHPGT